MPFDSRAAVDVADMTRIAIDAGDKKAGSGGAWAKVKFDRQIVAIAKNEHVTAIYSDDADIRNIAALFDIPVIGLLEMPIPPSALQGTLLLEPNPTTSAASESNPAQELPSSDEADAAMAEFVDPEPARSVTAPTVPGLNPPGGARSR